MSDGKLPSRKESYLEPVAPSAIRLGHFKPFGIDEAVVGTLINAIVRWLGGQELAWDRVTTISCFRGPQERSVVELMMLHAEDPQRREVLAEGAVNKCMVYMYEDHLTLHFTIDNPDRAECFVFKYTTLWHETEVALLKFLADTLTEHLLKIFKFEPRRFDGNDFEVVTVNAVVDNITRVLSGGGMMG